MEAEVFRSSSKERPAYRVDVRLPNDRWRHNAAGPARVEGAPKQQLLENDGFISIEQDAVFDVPANGAREDDLFDVAAFLDEFVDGVAMRYALDALFDDRAVVEHLGDVMRRGANEFYATVKSLLVRLGSDKRGQEGMMNVDDPLRKLLDEVCRQHLHV